MMPNPKHLPDVDILDLIWHKNQEKYMQLVKVLPDGEHKINATRKQLVKTYQEVYHA